LTDDYLHSDDPEDGEGGEQSPFSGQLGSPSTTWMNLLSGASDDGALSPYDTGGIRRVPRNPGGLATLPPTQPPENTASTAGDSAGASP